MISRSHPVETVIAAEEITEWNNDIVPTLHARKGQRGEVLHREEVDGLELVTVLFTRRAPREFGGVFASVTTCFLGGNVRAA